jgi:hypothetical protein
MIRDERSENGEPLSAFCYWFRSRRIWRHFANYFPVTLHKTQDLDPCFERLSTDVHPLYKKPVWKRLLFFWYYILVYRYMPLAESKATGKRYIFGYHPHGIIGMGAFGSIVSEGAKWSQMFPGIPVRLLTLSNNFVVPFYREYLLSLGLASVSKFSCKNLLRSNQPICIVIGGAQESLYARPGVMDLVLLKRYGFVKLALETGNTSLVPIVAFGENDIYQQATNDHDSLVFRFQQLIKKLLGFTVPFFHARGVFNYDVGLIPYRRPINVVVGREIPIPHIESPSKEEIRKYHNLYVDELRRVFEENKAKYFTNYSENGCNVENFKLNFVE